MARKRKSIQDNELLLPSMALCTLVFVIVGLLSISLNQDSTNTRVEADTPNRQLTEGYQQVDLETDLMLLQEDTLDTELESLDIIE